MRQSSPVESESEFWRVTSVSSECQLGSRELGGEVQQSSPQSSELVGDRVESLKWATPSAECQE